MGNSSRWRRLMEWLRYRQEFDEEINLDILIKAVYDIKEGKEISVTGFRPYITCDDVVESDSIITLKKDIKTMLTPVNGKE